MEIMDFVLKDSKIVAVIKPGNSADKPESYHPDSKST